MEIAFVIAAAMMGPSQSNDEAQTAKPISDKSSESPRPRIKAVAGSFSVTVSRVEVCPMTVQDAASKKMFDSKCEYLHVYLSIRNKSKGEKVDYVGWGNPSGELAGRPEARLVDNFGKKLEQIPGQKTFAIAGQLSTKPLYSGTTISDVLIFKRPEPGVEFVRARLSAKAVGTHGDFDLEIPASLWRPQAKPKAN